MKRKYSNFHIKEVISTDLINIKIIYSFDDIIYFEEKIKINSDMKYRKDINQDSINAIFFNLALAT